MKCSKCGNNNDVIFYGYTKVGEKDQHGYYSQHGYYRYHPEPYCAVCMVGSGNPYRGDEKLATDLANLKDAVAAVFSDLMNMDMRKLRGGS